jgi:hypothetical protein
VIALDVPLTTANSLDVWWPFGSALTSDAVLRSLYRNHS